MNEIIAKTKKGSEVIIKVNRDRLEGGSVWDLIISAPDLDIETSARWGRLNDHEGLIFKIDRNGKKEEAIAVMAEIRKGDVEAIKEVVRMEVRMEQAPFVKSALIFSGRYSQDLHFGKVIKAEDRISGAGKTVYQNAKFEERIDLQEIIDEPIIKVATTRAKETGTFYNGESSIYILSASDVIGIMKALKDRQDENSRADYESAWTMAIAEDKERRQSAIDFAEAVAEAARTGKRVFFRDCGVTAHCTNGNDDECSFDKVSTWACPDGSLKTEYQCCC